MAAKSVTFRGEAASALAILRLFADERGASLEETPIQNGVRARFGGAVSGGLNVYPSKGGVAKVVFDQPDAPLADQIVTLLGATANTASPISDRAGAVEPVLDDVASWLGSDESGKGDFFGPLVVAAVAVDRSTWRVLESLGVQDSKRISDARARSLAGDVRRAAPYEVVTIMPPRYNQLWKEFGNVNRLLAWAHARAIEEVLARAPDASAAVADQFGDESLIRRALFERGRQVRLVQMPRAERDPAVAAASILARAEFLRRLDQLGRSAGVRLPKGASAAVDSTARSLVQERGRGILTEVAKEHFKTTQRVTG
jgi:ribonuclease HIII